MGSVATQPTYFWQRRQFWIWSFVLIIVAVVGFVAWLPTTRALVQFHRVGLGMTEQEVEALLGAPASRSNFNTMWFGPAGGSNAARYWLVGELSLTVYLFDGKVVGKTLDTDLSIMRRFFPNLFGRNLL
jgi:hypothetical protein